VSRLVLDLEVGKAKGSEAGGGVGLIAEGISGLSGGGAVVAPTIGLDHQAELRPVEVDLEAVDHLLGQRRRQTGLRGERPKQDFELSVGEAEGPTIKQGA
jgi:hypothetical protein